MPRRKNESTSEDVDIRTPLGRMLKDFRAILRPYVSDGFALHMLSLELADPALDYAHTIVMGLVKEIGKPLGEAE